MAPSATEAPPGQSAAQSDSVDAAQFPESSLKAANVSQVKLYSPLRYPGGKTWLIPHVKEWLTKSRAKKLIEPFAGGAIVSLTAVMERLVNRAILIERDPDVAAFWRATLQHGAELAERVRAFRPTPESILELEQAAPRDVGVAQLVPGGTGDAVARAAAPEAAAADPGRQADGQMVSSCPSTPETDSPELIVARGFRTLVLNRTRRGGILAAGAASIRRGEDDKGIASRWYPDTLASRLEAIGQQADRIKFLERDSTEILEDLLCCGKPDAAVFLDPPYTAGGRYAGRRLYTYNELDHKRLFEILADHGANMLMTYDASPEIAKLVKSYQFHAVRVSMRTAHYHNRIELVITRDRLFHEGGRDD